MLPMTVLRRFDCVLASTKPQVLAEYQKRKDTLTGDALDASNSINRHSNCLIKSIKTTSFCRT
jgi:hypothetical protein